MFWPVYVSDSHLNKRPFDNCKKMRILTSQGFQALGMFSLFIINSFVMEIYLPDQ